MSEVRELWRKAAQAMVDQENAITEETGEMVRQAVSEAPLSGLEEAVRESFDEVLKEDISGLVEVVSSKNPGTERALNKNAFYTDQASNSDDTHEEKKNTAAFFKSETDRKEGTDRLERSTELTGRYVYGVVESSTIEELGPIGLDGAFVYLITCDGLGAIVHDCPCSPYQTDDEIVVKAWVLTHQKVLDDAAERFVTVLPCGFGTIIEGKDENVAVIVKRWLRDEAARLREKLEKVKGRKEYGIQILYNPELMGENVIASNAELIRLREEIHSKSPGLAYMYQQKLEKLVKQELESMIGQDYREFYRTIEQYTMDIKVERVKNVNMLMNISCLVDESKVKELGDALDIINGREGFEVRFTGPWPPYSFVSVI